MPTILISLMSPPEATPALGHLPPVYRFSELARERGYEVAWCCSEAFSDAILRDYADDKIRCYPDPTIMGTPRVLQPLFSRILSADIPQRMLPKLEDEHNHEWLFDSYVAVGFDQERFFLPALETTLSALNEFQPEFMFTYGCPVGLTAGHISGVPVVTFDNLMRLRNEGGENYRRMNDVVQKAIELYSPFETDHIPLEDIIRNGRQFRLLSTVKHLGRKPYSENEFFVGGFKQPQALAMDMTPVEAPIDNVSKTVYAYFGSASISFRLVREILPRVFEEVNRLFATPYDCYVSSSYVDKPYDVGAVHFAPFYDAAAFLPYASYVFCHAGINMVMQAMTQGVPLIMVPGAIHERRHNAHEVTAVNAGLLLEIEDFTAPMLSSILLDQAQERQLRQSAQHVQQHIIDSGGMQSAFEEMERHWLAPYDKGRLELVARHMRML